MPLCRICNNSAGNTPYSVREMMFGLRERFDYFQCGQCQCLQINEVPADLSRYYPENYYSYQAPPVTADNPVKALLKRHRAAAGLGRGNLMQRLLATVYRPPDYYRWFRRIGLGLDSSVLDVGCGIGHLLLRMRKDGFTALTGADPFLPESIFYPNGVTVLNNELSQLDGRFDCIMLHHSFEHMPHPLQALQEIARLLKHDRHALVRIPVASSYAWRHYREDWVNLDAPRHLFLHSLESMRLLAEQAGLKTAAVVFDSDEGQFWGSEQYRRDIPLRAPRSRAENPADSLFSNTEIRAFRRKAARLNNNNDGDMACFYLYKP